MAKSAEEQKARLAEVRAKAFKKGQEHGAIRRNIQTTTAQTISVGATVVTGYIHGSFAKAEQA